MRSTLVYVHNMLNREFPKRHTSMSNVTTWSYKIAVLYSDVNIQIWLQMRCENIPEMQLQDISQIISWATPIRSETHDTRSYWF